MCDEEIRIPKGTGCSQVTVNLHRDHSFQQPNVYTLPLTLWIVRYGWATSGSDATLLDKLDRGFGGKKYYIKRKMGNPVFTIDHYAGQVPDRLSAMPSVYLAERSCVVCARVHDTR